jgi:outer membrane lipopolysaccharide assembly protein LptE/RlpB
MRFTKLLLLAICAVCVSCSYSFRGRVAGDVKSIAIPTFENESAEFGIAESITEELIRGFQRDGTLKVTSQDQADAVLLGRVVRVEDQPYTARADQTVEEYRLSVTCEIELVNTKTNESAWKQVYPAWAIYPYTGSLDARDQALREAVGKLREDLLNRIVGNW